MATKPKPTDLRGRRQAAGVSLNEMAHGIGLRIAQVTEIEDGTASDDMKNHYARWLDIIERWDDYELRRQLRQADEGHRFRLD